MTNEKGEWPFGLAKTFGAVCEGAAFMGPFADRRSTSAVRRTFAILKGPFPEKGNGPSNRLKFSHKPQHSRNPHRPPLAETPNGKFAAACEP